MSGRTILALLSSAILSGAQTVVIPSHPLPVITRAQVVFSIVGHHNHIPDRVSFYNQNATPRGNTNYVVPHLACDPVVTLYNPHSEPIDLPSLRVRIWNPPMGFRFKKNGNFLRNEFAAGDFVGMAKLYVGSQFNTSAQKTFTFHLSELNSSSAPGNPIHLEPGETRSYSAWVDNNWSWGLENSGGAYIPRSFFDFRTEYDFTNRDGRTGNLMGAEAVGYDSSGPGRIIWDPRAGFQTDHLSVNQDRPSNTIYPFEGGTNGWVAIKLDDTFTVEARPQKAFVANASSAEEPDFRLSLLAGLQTSANKDVHQDFRFSADQIINESGAAVVERTYRAGDLLQAANDLTPGGKTPFAAISIVAKREALASGGLEELGWKNGDELYETVFSGLSALADETLDYAGIGQVHYPLVDAANNLAAKLGSDGRFHITVATPVDLSGVKIMGGTSPSNMNSDVTNQASIVPLPLSPTGGSKLYRISLDSGALGPRYFIRLKKGPGIAPLDPITPRAK